MTYVRKSGKLEQIRANFPPIPAISGKDGLGRTGADAIRASGENPHIKVGYMAAASILHI